MFNSYVTIKEYVLTKTQSYKENPTQNNRFVLANLEEDYTLFVLQELFSSDAAEAEIETKLQAF